MNKKKVIGAIFIIIAFAIAIYAIVPKGENEKEETTRTWIRVVQAYL